MAHKNTSNYSAYTARQKARGQTSAPAGKKLGHHKKPVKIFTLEEADERLADVFRNHSAEYISHSLRKRLAEFYVLLMENQEKENFTRLLTLKDVGIKHFIDSLIITQLTKLKFPLLDVGTGPGFPGIPLKLFYPQEKVLLAEGVQRRVQFLKDVRERMKLQQLDIVGRNINDDFVYPVQGAITRAVEEISNTLRNVMFSVQNGGRVYFMKGPGVDEEIRRVPKDLLKCYKLVEDHAYVLPQTPHQRRLVVYEKIWTPELPDMEEEDSDSNEDTNLPLKSENSSPRPPRSKGHDE